MKAVAVFLVVLFVGVIVSAIPVNVAALGSPTWNGGAAIVTQNSLLSTNASSNCAGYTQDLFISELKTSTRVCVYGDERLKIGYFSRGGPYIGVVGFPYSNEMHVLEGICGGMTCRYSADKDMIVTQQSVSQFGWGVVVYLHVSERIKQTRSSTGDVQYVFDATNPDYAVKNDVGRYIWTPSFAISENGKWVVVELRDMGLALIDTDSFSIRQIITNGYKYGYGMDPTQQLAVSNDGKSVAAMGMNAGFRVIDVNAACGQDLVGDLSRQPGTVECPSSELTIGALFPNFYLAEYPRFFGDGYQLEATVHSWMDGSRKVTFLAHGAVAAHKLKLLALGDSFTSGEGETDKNFYEPGTDEMFDTCHVSKRSYPLLVSAAIGIGTGDAKSVACSGAKIGDIVGSNDTYWGQSDRLGAAGLKMSPSEKAVAQEEALDNFQPGRSRQLAFLERYNPDMITIGVGGNDAGLMGKLKVCAMPGTCEWAQGEGLSATANEIKRLSDTLASLFSQISERYPSTRVYVAGYPDIINVNGSCDPITELLLDHTERVFIENSMLYLNHVIRAATQKAGFTYLDIEQAMGGKGLCNGSATVAMNGLRLGDDIAVISSLPMIKVIGSETFHPTPIGHGMIANTILAGHPGLRQDATCATDPMRCNDPVISIEAPAYWGTRAREGERQTYVTEFASQTDESLKQLVISLPGGALEPQSTVSVEIHSEPKSLGTLTVDGKGGVSGAVSLPADLIAGFHTLHLLGVNREGELIDMYQFIDVGQKGEVLSVGAEEGNPPSPRDGSTSFKANELLKSSDSTGVLGVSSLASPTVISKSALMEPVRYMKRVMQHDGVLIVIVIGGIVSILLVLVIILLRRRLAKPSS